MVLVMTSKDLSKHAAVHLLSVKILFTNIKTTDCSLESIL